MGIILAALLALQQDSLVDQLGSEDSAVRRDAEAKLLDMGRKAVPLVKMALDHDDLEVRSRARKLAFAVGLDPDTRVHWETTWAAYKARPYEISRWAVLGIHFDVASPVATLMRKVDKGLFALDADVRDTAALSVAEWDVLDEVMGVALLDISKDWVPKLGAIALESSKSWLLYSRGLRLMSDGAPRDEAQAAFRCLLRACPTSKYGATAKRYVEGLQAMSLEVEAAGRAELTDSDRALRWIHQLREIGKGKDGLELNLNILAAPGDAPGRLVVLGYAALPHLMKLLEDKRLTRLVGISTQDRTGSVVSYHDAAVQIMNQITGLNMYERKSAWDHPRIGPEERVARVYREWWDRNAGKEPVEWLRDWVEGEGSYRRSTAAERLVKAIGDDAVPSLLKALELTSEVDQSAIVKLLGNAKGKGIIPALEKLLGVRELDRRVVRSVADAMGRHGDIRGLKRLRDTIAPSKSTLFTLIGDFEVLMDSGRPEFIQAVKTYAADMDGPFNAHQAAEAVIKARER